LHDIVNRKKTALQTAMSIGLYHGNKDLS